MSILPVTSRTRRMFAAAAASAMLACGLIAPTASAADNPTITYDGAANQITIESTSGTDLFAQFKNLVPGDTITQTIDLDFTHISADTRLYLQAGTSSLTDEQAAVLSKLTVSATFNGSGIVAEPASAAPQSLFADPVHVATVTEPGKATMTLTVAIPVELGNELAELATVTIPWIITVQEEDGNEGDSTALTPHAADLVAYEGGIGSNGDGTTGNALPDPEWTNIDWDTARVTVDNETWDVTEYGMPFDWYYADIADGVLTPIRDSARIGTYHLCIEPLTTDPRDGQDFDGVPVTTINGKLVEWPEDEYGIVTTDDGSDTMISVRDITDNDGADTLSADLFRPVYGEESPTLLERLGTFFAPAAYADGVYEALEGEFNKNGVHDGDCDGSESHAHVQPGTTFVKNGDANMPVNDDARIGLLQDDYLPDVLGSEPRMAMLDAKARAAAGLDADDVSHAFTYLDLVDMNDGNLWVSTADGSDTTVYLPFSGDDLAGADASDKFAVVRFDGLTRDYTVDMAAADPGRLDQVIADAGATVLPVTVTDDGILFDVPSAGFGAFEVLWTDGTGGSEPGPDDSGDSGEQPGGQPGVDDDYGHGGEQTADTGAAVIAVAVAAIVAATIGVILLLVVRRRRKEA